MHRVEDGECESRACGPCTCGGDLVNGWLLLVAQLGPRAARKHAREMLVDRADLPGDGWKQGRFDLVWRTGFRTRPSEAARRARRARTFTAIRRFKHIAPPRWLWVEVIPFTSALDALSVLPDLETLFTRNPRARATSEGRLEPLEIPELADFPYVYEASTIDRVGGRAGCSRYVAGAAGHVVFLVGCSGFGPDGSWPWADVAAVAAAQASRITSVLAASPD